MTNIVIATPALVEAATITASNEVAAMPAASLKLRPGANLWRATSLASVYLEIDLGAAYAINLIALLYTNASSAATWRIRGATSQPNLTAAPGYDSGSLSHWPVAGLSDWAWTHALKFLDVAQNFRWWRIDIDDAANPAGYYQAGRLYIASAWQGGRNYDYGIQYGWEDPSEDARTQGGQSVTLDMAQRRVLQFTINNLTEAEAFANAFEIDRLRGKKRDVLVIPNPTSAAQIMRQTVCGKIEDLSPLAHVAFPSFGKSYRIVEMLP